MDMVCSKHWPPGWDFVFAVLTKAYQFNWMIRNLSTKKQSRVCIKNWDTMLRVCVCSASENQAVLLNELVSWWFEPSQPHGVILGLISGWQVGWSMHSVPQSWAPCWEAESGVLVAMSAGVLVQMYTAALPLGAWRHLTVFIKLQTHKRLKTTLFIRTKHSMRILRVSSPFSSYKTTLRTRT